MILNGYKRIFFLPFIVLIAATHSSFAQYCDTSLYNFGCINRDYIDDISIESFHQTATGCVSGSIGYSDYTNDTIRLFQGSKDTLIVSVGNANEYVSMWIDLNDNGTFQPSEEFVTNLLCETPGVDYSAIFSFPCEAQTGNHRIRIRCTPNSSFIDPCAIYLFGETQDYTLSMLPAVSNLSYLSGTCTQTNNSTTVFGAQNVQIIGIQIKTTGCLNPFSATSFTINSNGSTDFLNDVTNVKIYYTGNDSNFATTNFFGSDSSLTQPISGSQSLLEGTNYFWVSYDISNIASFGDYIDAECTQITMSGAGGIQTPTVTAPYGARQIKYCIPISTGGCGNSFINGITLNTLNNQNTECNKFPFSYIQYPVSTNTTTDLELGATYGIILQGPPSGNTGFGVWIDFNYDGDFGDADEFVFSSPGYVDPIQTGVITIPNNAAYLGQRRMRVRSIAAGQFGAEESCDNIYNGETEDYTVNIVPPTPMKYDSTIAFQDVQDVVTTGTSNAQILGVKVVTSGSLDPFTVTSLTVNSIGSTNFFNDVSKVKVFYTGVNPVFSTDNLFGSSTTLSSPITGNQTISSGTNYFWVTYDVKSTAKIDDTLDAQCTIVTISSIGDQIPVVTSPEGNRIIDYCVPSSFYGCYDGNINSVIFNTLDNENTGCTGNANSYIKYPADNNTTTSVEIGTTYPITLVGGQPFDPVGFGVWIDFNNEGKFNSTNEFVFSSPEADFGEQDGSLTIPDDSSLIGTHRMRVRSKAYDIVLPDDACTDFLYNPGETEDYTITITPHLPMTYFSSAAFQNNHDVVAVGEQNVEILGVQVITKGSISPFDATSFTINSNGSTNFSNDVSGIKIYYTGSSSLFSIADLFGSTTNLSSPITGDQPLLQGINYFWVTYDLTPASAVGDYLDAACTQIALSGAGGIQVPSITSPDGNRQINYCTPSVINGCSNDYIDLVEFNTLKNDSSDCNGSVSGYINYAPTGNFTTNVKFDSSYLISLKALSPNADEFGFGVWIDFNNNGSFDAEGEYVYSSKFTSTELQTATIKIPGNSLSFAGARRMRVRVRANDLFTAAESCTDIYDGETEDYTIQIISPPSCSGSPDAGVASADPTAFCSAGNSTTLTLENYSVGSNITIQWQTSSDEINWTDIHEATSDVYNTPALYDTTFYRAKVLCSVSGESVFSNAVRVDVGTNAIISVSDSTICGVGNITLQATGNSNYVLWYADSTGGDPIYESASPSSFKVSPPATTTYYVTAAAGLITTDSVGAILNGEDTVGFYTFSGALLFDVSHPCTLLGVYVYPGEAGNVVISWEDANFAILQTATVVITSSQVKKKTFIPLNFKLTPGTNYQLFPDVGSVPLFESFFGASYPYDIPGVLSITGSLSGSTYYDYFFNWIVKVSDVCESSPRIPVTAMILPAPPLTVTTDPANATICSGAGQSVTINATGDFTSYTWSPAAGLSSTSGANVIASPNETTNYVVIASNEACTNTDAIAVKVVAPPSAIVTATPDSICPGLSVQLYALLPPAGYVVDKISFAPLSGKGIKVKLGDNDVSSPLSIGFKFNFYGKDYTKFFISSNGFISFDASSGDGCCAGEILPNAGAGTDDLIAAAWADLNPKNGGTISYFTTGTAPNRILVVRFDSVSHCCSLNTDPVTTQILLYETSNKIEIHTTSMPGNPHGFYWGAHTEGIENKDGTLATTVPGRNGDNTWTAYNDAWRFTPNSFTYQWSPSNSLSDSIISNPVATPDVTTTYTVTITDQFSSCNSNEEVAVNVLPSPNPGKIIATSNSVCISGSVNLTLINYTSGASIQWQQSSVSGGPYIDISGATSTTYQTPVISSTNYYVAKVTCTNTSLSPEISIEALTHPVPPIGTDGIRCDAGSVILKATGLGNLNWYDAGSNGEYLGSGSPFFTPIINLSAVFYVEDVIGAPPNSPLTTAFNGTNFDNGQMFDVTVNHPLTISSFDAHLFDRNYSSVIIFYSENSHEGHEQDIASWKFLGSASNVQGFGYGNLTPIPINVNLEIQPGQTFSFYITAASGSDFIYESFDDSNEIVFASDANIQLSNGTGNGYPFSYFNPRVMWNGTVHYVTKGCASTLTPVNAIIYHPQISATTNDNDICSGTMIQLNAQNNGVGSFNYQWKPLQQGMNPPSGFGASITAVPLTTTVYTVIATEINNQCDTSLSIPVNVRATPVVTFIGLNSIYHINDAPVTLTGVPAGGIFSGQGINGNVFDPAAAGIGGPYTITYSFTDTNGCTGTFSLQTTVTYPVGMDNISLDHSIFIYPNPNEGKFLLDIKFHQPAKKVTIRFVNESGQTVYENNFGEMNKELKKQFDFPLLPKENYFLEIFIDDQRFYRKVTVQ